MQWFKLNAQVFADSKIIKLRARRGGDTYFAFWVQLLCLAAQLNMAGYLLDEEGPLSTETLSNLTGFTQNSVEKMTEILRKIGLLGFEENTYFLPNWEKCQNGDRLEKIRAAERTKKQKQRARKQALVREMMGDVPGVSPHGVPGNVPGTSPPQNKKKEEKEIENKNIKAEAPQKEGANTINSQWKKVVDDYCLRFEGEQAGRVAELLYTWLGNQKEKGKGFSVPSLTLNLEKVQAMAKASHLSVEQYIKEVVCRGWSGFYPIPAYQQVPPEEKRTASYNIEELEALICGRGEGQ